MIPESIPKATRWHLPFARTQRLKATCHVGDANFVPDPDSSSRPCRQRKSRPAPRGLGSRRANPARWKRRSSMPCLNEARALPACIDKAHGFLRCTPLSKLAPPMIGSFLFLNHLSVSVPALCKHCLHIITLRCRPRTSQFSYPERKRKCQEISLNQAFAIERVGREVDGPVSWMGPNRVIVAEQREQPRCGWWQPPPAIEKVHVTPGAAR